MTGTKKSLLASGLSLAVSAALLVGTTFAWFTDSVVNTGNKIQAGTLDVQLLKDGVDISESTQPVFDYDLWEPGYSTGADLAVRNNGTLALKYELELQDVTTTKGIENVIDVLIDGVAEGTLANYMNGENLDEGTLAAKATSAVKSIVLKMQEGAGNEYQGATATFDILLKATQAPVEADGFGNPNYDANATFEQVTVDYDETATPEENGAALQAAINNIDDGGTVFVPAGEYSLGVLDIGDKEVVIQGEDGTVLTRIDEGFITVRGSENAKFTVRGITFEGTTPNDTSGTRGICFSGQMNSDATVVVDSCDFKNLTTGIYLGGVANATVTDCSFTDCYAGIGGTESITGTLLVDSCEFEGNTENIGWAGEGKLVIKNSPTCKSYKDYTDDPNGEVISLYVEVDSVADLTQALNTANPGATIFVKAGNYTLSDIVLEGKDVVIQGEAGSTNINALTFQYAKNNNITVRGISFKGNNAATDLGIVCTDNQSENNTLTVEDCTFEDLQTGIYLGGVVDATITNCSFTDCYAGIGGSESITGTLTVDSCTFAENDENIGWAGEGNLVITDCPTCTSFNQYQGATATTVTVENGEYNG